MRPPPTRVMRAKYRAVVLEKMQLASESGAAREARIKESEVGRGRERIIESPREFFVGVRLMARVALQFSRCVAEVVGGGGGGSLPRQSLSRCFKHPDIDPRVYPRGEATVKPRVSSSRRGAEFAGAARRGR